MRTPGTHLRSSAVAVLGAVLLASATLAAADEDAASKGAFTGGVSEEEFKALHQLKKDSAPPLHGTMIEIAKSRAYLSLPPAAKARLTGGVVVIHEWWGLNDHIKHYADRLAAEGYAALAVDLYDGKIATTPDSAMAYMKVVHEDRALKILKAAHDFLRSDQQVDVKKTASIGWCFGGGWLLQLVLHEQKLDAAVIYYGRLVTDPKVLKSIDAPVLGIFGNEDEVITPETVDAFEKALATADVEHRLYRYDAPHAFANPSNPEYNQEAAGDAWAQVLKFLREEFED